LEAFVCLGIAYQRAFHSDEPWLAVRLQPPEKNRLVVGKLDVSGESHKIEIAKGPATVPRMHCTKPCLPQDHCESIQKAF
jgi:hypothetical protein